jgi:hypothetical protein
LPGRRFVGAAKESGTPNKTARDAAREKFSTDVIEITVDARQRLKAFRSAWRGAGVESSGTGFVSGDVSSAERQLKTIRENGISGRYEVLL